MSSSGELEQAYLQLEALLGKRVSRSAAQREHHSHGESYHPPVMPDMVCMPQTTDEVSGVMKVSAKYGIPVVPFGAGSSLEGHVHPLHGGISLDMRQMNKVLRVSAEDMDATVEAGITRLELNRALNNTGLTFFVDPGADATIGGMTATGASGTTAVRYGTMRDNVLALTVVLPDGRTIHTGSRARKSSAGYDLTHLFVGSEGTLGVITEVTLRLHPLPESVIAAVATFPSVQHAVDTAVEAMQLALDLARIEFLDENQVAAINLFSKTELPAMPTLFFEFHGLSDAGTSEQAAMLQSIAQEHSALSFVSEKSLEGRERLWEARHNAHYATQALRPGSKVWTTDACVPLSRLTECILQTKADMQGLTFPATIVGHVGDGNFHVLCALDENNPEEMAECARFSDRTVERAQAMDGTCTGEHGVGYGKIKHLRAEHGEGVDVMRAIKMALDGENRMNPGKIFESPANFQAKGCLPRSTTIPEITNKS